ncbi:MAG: hypothetical protein BGO43_09170 [Gammaproteobacteria bacterium 39-13]|nr:acyltransferase [Gammaproteobacteria bacterium]OJV89914.1 MAG: hypothetical protein BGO43_09170 [Gammaproteobacteria bacterium 39-13]
MKALKRIGSTLKGCFNALFLAVHTIFWCIPMYLLFCLKVLSFHPVMLKFINRCLIATANSWIQTNNLMMDISMNVKWDLPDFSHLKLNQWYFIVCNHQSWTDILVLQRIFLRKIPFIRFFIKKELMWLPVLNLAWWAYDFPIMHRHTQEQIAKNPELRVKDLQATQKACSRYKDSPVTILNFLEGTRFTSAKHAKQRSPYKNLLVPKSGGFAFAVNVMNKQIHHILDVTIIYPEGRKSYWDFLCGRVREITVKLQEHEIPTELLEGNYTEDEVYRNKFKNWINDLWQKKDQELMKFTFSTQI